MTINQRKSLQQFLRRPARSTQWVGDRIGEVLAACIVLWVVAMLLA